MAEKRGRSRDRRDGRPGGRAGRGSRDDGQEGAPPGGADRAGDAARAVRRPGGGGTGRADAAERSPGPRRRRVGRADAGLGEHRDQEGRPAGARGRVAPGARPAGYHRRLGHRRGPRSPAGPARRLAQGPVQASGLRHRADRLRRAGTARGRGALAQSRAGDVGGQGHGPGRARGPARLVGKRRARPAGVAGQGSGGLRTDRRPRRMGRAGRHRPAGGQGRGVHRDRARVPHGRRGRPWLREGGFRPAGSGPLRSS